MSKKSDPIDKAKSCGIVGADKKNRKACNKVRKATEPAQI